MEWVLDASVALSWCFDDEQTPYTEGLLDRLRTSPAIAPQIWPLEVANVMSLAVRRGKITLSERAEFIQVLRSHPVYIDDQTGRNAFDAILILADQHELTCYDAAYLELAMRLEIPLATLEMHLQAAARQAGVPLL